MWIRHLAGMFSYGIPLVALLVLVGFFPVAVLFWVTVVGAATIWRAAQ